MFYKDKKNATYQYERSGIEYAIASCNHADANYTSIINSFTYNSITVNNDTISVDVDVKQSIKLSLLKESEDLVTKHTLTLKTTQLGLYILDDKYDSELNDLFPTTDSFEKATKEFADGTYDKRMSDMDKNAEVCSDVISYSFSRDTDTNVIPHSPSGEYYITYNRNRAVEYADAWTSEGTEFSNTSYNNAQFASYYMNDCQNYVSQCIWAGFGGTTSVNNPLPMTTDWYAGSYKWNVCPAFYNYITSNYYNNDYGPRGENINVTSLMKGDYAYNSSSEEEHVVFIVRTDGTWAGTYFNAHTYNHKNHSIAITYKASQPSTLQFVHVRNFKWGD